MNDINEMGGTQLLDPISFFTTLPLNIVNKKQGGEKGNRLATKVTTCRCSSPGSYGSLARFRSVSRVRKVTDSCVVAASGDYADFQFLDRLTEYLT